MGLAAKISIALDANTAQLKTGFAQATGAIQKLDAGMSSSVAMGMAKFHVGLAAVKGALASVSGAINSVIDAMHGLDKIEKTASKLGLTADQLRILDFAAEQTGVSAGTMEMALQRMTRRVAEAAKGSGEAVNALKELGVSAEYLNSLSPDKQFAVLADAMGGVSSQSDKVRLAMKLFDSEGVSLVNTMTGGSASLNAFGKDAERLGLLIGDSGKKVTEANDSINRMKHAWGAFVSQVAIAVAPALTAIADILSTVVGFFNRLIGSASGAAGSMKKFGAESKAAKSAFIPDDKEMRKAAEAAAKESEKALEAIKSKAESITTSLRTPLEIYRDTMNELNSLVEGGALSWDVYTRGVKKASEELYKGKGVIADWKTPSIGAMTRGSAEAFSAVQAAKRERDDAERRHREVLAADARIESAIRESSITLAPVHI